MARIKNMFELEVVLKANEQSQRATLHRFTEAVASNAFAALRYDSQSAIVAAAQLDVCMALQQTTTDGGTLATVHEYIVARLSSIARSLTSRSTSPIANMADDAAAAYLGALLDQIGGAL